MIATYGSRGDVQPYVALGKGLQNAGHNVILGTSERFREFVEDHGLAYGYMNDELLAIIDTDQGKERLENTKPVRCSEAEHQAGKTGLTDAGGPDA